MRHWPFVALLAGCASGGTAANDIDAPPMKVWLDGSVEQHVDAAIDAEPHVDAPPDTGCVPMMTELLTNPVFDLTPLGTGWTQTPIDAQYPPITSDNGQLSQYPPQSAPYKAWLGGFVAPTIGQTVTDVVYQDVMVPPSTTAVVLTGYYLVDTAETGATVYDTGSLALTSTNGTLIENVLSLTNVTTTSATWTAINHTFAGNLSNQTVRLRMTTSNDYSNTTNFMFDTFSLEAMRCL